MDIYEYCRSHSFRAFLVRVRGLSQNSSFMAQLAHEEQKPKRVTDPREADDIMAAWAGVGR